MCDNAKPRVRTCVHCHREWQAKCPKARYCSTRCQYLAAGSRVILACQACGHDFDCKAMEMRAGRRFCSRACMLSVRRRPTKTCPECGKMFAPRHRKDTSKGKGIYCSKRCAGAARRAGKRDGRWKEAQELRACLAKVKPSQRMYAAMQKAMQRQLDGIASLWRAMSEWRACLHCGGFLKNHANEETMFCSILCAAAYEHQIKCRLCGKQCVKRGMQGGRGMCLACKRIADKANSRKGYRRKIPKICERDGWRCQLCLCRLIKTWRLDQHGVPHPRCRTLDHILPRSAGGTDDDWNLQACCFKCNYEKGAQRKGQLRFALRP